MKKYCKECGHICHCVGKGYHVSESFCDSCNCNQCKCVSQEPLVLTKLKRSKKFEYSIIIILLLLVILINTL